MSPMGCYKPDGDDDAVDTTWDLKIRSGISIYFEMFYIFPVIYVDDLCDIWIEEKMICLN